MALSEKVTLVRTDYGKRNAQKPFWLLSFFIIRYNISASWFPYRRSFFLRLSLHPVVVFGGGCEDDVAA